MSQLMEHGKKFHLPLLGLALRKTFIYDFFSFPVCSLDVDAQGELVARYKRWQILCEPWSPRDSVEQNSMEPPPSHQLDFVI